MMNSPTPRVAARIPDDLMNAARARSPELADASPSLLIRIGLAVLAGFTVAKALESVTYKPVPTGGRQIDFKPGNRAA